MVVELFVAAAQVGHGDVDFHAAGFGLRVVFHGAAKVVETAGVGAGVEVVDGETGVGVMAVDFIGVGLGAAEGGGENGKGKGFFHLVILLMRWDYCERTRTWRITTGVRGTS